MIREINKIDIYKASGMPEISSYLIKHAFSNIPIVLQHLFNCSLRTGIFPKAWKQGTVIPIPKVSNPQSPSDLRPVTLLPIPGKMISCNQNGFRKHHGTSDTIFKFLGGIFDQLNEKNSTLAIFIDFKKAFDTLDHQILMQKLEKLELSQNVYNLLGDYLNNRSQCSFVNNISSDRKSLSHGVPQGSILGPVLFNVYINDIVKFAKRNILLYADDSVIFDSSDDISAFIYHHSS